MSLIGRLFNPLTILLAVSCLQWVVVAEAGSFTVLAPYLALGIVCLHACTGPKKLSAATMYLRQNATWIVPLAAYLIILTPLLWDTRAGTHAPRQIFFLIGGVGVAASIIAGRNIGKIFRLGAALGLAVFVVCVEFLARRVGLSWADAIREFFGNGNLHFVVYQFFTPVFNYVDPTNPDQFSASTKNGVAGCVLVLALLFRSGSARPEKDVVGMAFLGVALALLVVLNDRSVLIAAAASVFLATVLGAFARPARNVPLLAFKLTGMAALVVFAFGAALPFADLFGTLGERFSFEDASTSSRLTQYSAALDRIALHPWAGSGYFEINGYLIHNAFLGAWVYAGLGALILVLTFYVVVLARWGVFISGVLKRRSRWVLPVAIEWVAVLPVMPLFRVWISGEGGILKFAEWIALSAFFGVWLANTYRRRAVARTINRQRAAAQMPTIAPAMPWMVDGSPRVPSGRFA